MNWRDDAATEKQLNYLQRLGIVPDHALTKGEASDLITRAEPTKFALEFEEEERNQAYHLHIACAEAKSLLAKAEKGEIRDAKSDVRDEQRQRLEFWNWAFRPPDGSEMYQQPIKLYLEQGYRFKQPSTKHLQDVLDALDADSATWDRETPEYLFQTLEHNFPELLRRNPDLKMLAEYRALYGQPAQTSQSSTNRATKASGCLSLLAFVFMIACAILFVFNR